MDQTFKLLLLISFALSQNNLDYSKASKRIEEAVRQGKINRQEANDRYRNLEKDYKRVVKEVLELMIYLFTFLN